MNLQWWCLAPGTEDVASSVALRVTYIPRLFYLSPEHHAGILRKHLHFHPATASQTAQTTCRRDRKDGKLPQESTPNRLTATDSLFPRAFQPLYLQIQTISGVPGGRIMIESFLHFKTVLLPPSLLELPVSVWCWSHCEDAWVRLTSGDSTARACRKLASPVGSSSLLSFKKAQT